MSPFSQFGAPSAKPMEGAAEPPSGGRGGRGTTRPSFKVHVRHVDAHLSRELDERGHQEPKRAGEQ